MRRYPVGVAVATVEVDGDRLGLTVSSLVSLALEPPLVGISIWRQAALHELLREAGGFAVSLLAGDQLELAQHFSRGVPPIAMWHGIDDPGERSRPAARGRRRLARVRARRRARGRRPHALPRARRARGARRRRSAAAAARRRLPPRMIDAVVFDLDGVIVDSEQVWDDVREQLVKGARRALARRRAGGDDGDELARVVARTCTTRSASPSRRRRSTPRSSSGCSSATASSCR